MKIRFGWVVILLMVLTACAPAKRSKSWTSIPPVQTKETRFFDVRFEPLKKDKRFFVVFRLDVRNKTSRELTIDWNKTRYLHNGRPYGVFAFPGIDPATIKKAIPPDTIAPGDTFSKEVFPVNLVAFTPMRDEVLDKKGKGLFPGPIPAGQSGIHLVVGQGGKDIVQKLTVEIQ
ncbi:MAG: hypothetical protein JRL30_17730 [Deltaproteobacteria bacterium]|nr:hypothetical protein [Deltaproteobacteria bacterium]